MKGVWEALNYCIENKEDEEDCFGYWWDGWVGEKKCYDCGEGIMEVKLHTEYPIKGWKKGGIIGQEGDEIRCDVRMTFPYFECPECEFAYTNWIHGELEEETRKRDDPKFREWMKLSAEERYGSKKANYDMNDIKDT